MTNTQLDLTADVIDVRDIIQRVEELDEEIGSFNDDTSNETAIELSNEHLLLTTIFEDLKGKGGDEQWRGDWYPITLIRDSYFTDYTQELLADCDYIPRDLPHWIVIDWEATARNVRFDYLGIEIEGATYWYR